MLAILCTAAPYPQKKIWEEAPAPIFFWGEGSAVHRLELAKCLRLKIYNIFGELFVKEVLSLPATSSFPEASGASRAISNARVNALALASSFICHTGVTSDDNPKQKACSQPKAFLTLYNYRLSVHLQVDACFINRKKKVLMKKSYMIIMNCLI